jgi:phage tail-like protein
LDSGIYRCQWHRIELDLAAPLPPGSKVTVSTYSFDEESTQIPGPVSVLWAAGGSFLGQLQQEPSGLKGTTLDALVQSREGRFLAVMVQVQGDGYSTPEIRAMRIHYPRVSYLNYLPAVYSADDESLWFMERFLSVFQTEWDALEDRIEHSAALFDPAAVPAEFLDVIAGWLGLPLEETWNEEKKRAMLKAVPRIYPKRGTQEGLRLHLQVYLENMNEVPVEKQLEFPLLLEGFRERQQVILSGKSGPHLDRQTQLWGPKQVGRLQLDVFATEGDVRLVSTGDPELDLFQEYAHRFRVFVPSAWVKTASDEAMLRRAIEAEKPAQTVYDLCLVEPRFQVGIQSMVGINTIIGQIPTVHLPSWDQLQNEPPSRAPHGRLGYDTVLGGTLPPAGSIYQISASFDRMVS